MKKNVACPACKGKGYNTVVTGNRNDYCGVMNENCSECEGTGLKLVDVTNADRIRAMSDEELEAFLIDVDLDKAGSPFINEWGKWLQQPAEGE